MLGKEFLEKITPYLEGEYEALLKNNTKVVKFKKKDPTAKPFVYSREDDACMDVYSVGFVEIHPMETVVLDTGIALEIPDGYEGLIRGRSGLSSKGLLVHSGTIESTYRGSIGVIMTNLGKIIAVIEPGTRVAQFTIKPVTPIKLKEDELTTTQRGENGYGSSGLK